MSITIKQPTFDSTPEARSLPRRVEKQQWQVWYRTEDDQEREVTITADVRRTMGSVCEFVEEEYGEVLSIKRLPKNKA